MTATALKTTARTHAPSLHISKTYQQYQAEIENYTRLAWLTAYTALWNTLHFSAEEKQTAKAYIRQFLMAADSHPQAFSQLIQRILLARQYLNTHPGQLAALPSNWFNPSNTRGFAGTERWLSQIEQVRHSLPKYKQGLRLFSKALTETTESKNPALFHQWRSWFILHNNQSLLNCYLSILANHSFGQ